MRYPVPALVCLLIAFPAAGETQSLAEAAREERERREQLQQDASSDETPSYGNEDLEEEEQDEDADADGVADDEDAGEGERAEKARERARQHLLRAASDRRDRERREAEAVWRSAAAQARSRIDEAKQELATLDELWLVEGERYVDSEGRTVIRDLDHLRELEQRARQELAAAEQALAELRTRARREGVPPGWLR